MGNTPEIKGWCPGAHRPMMSGDGLVVRVRPRLAQFTATQVLGLCAAADRFGAGLIDLTNRANVQIRGVSPDAWPALIERLTTLDLLDADEATERRRNILVEPLWTTGSDTERLATELMERLDDLPDLPAKMGFAIDAGTRPLLGACSADFRIERAGDRRLILRAEGQERGGALTPGREIDTLIALAHWFVDSGGMAAGRMQRHGAPLPDWATPDIAPAIAAAPLRPGGHGLGMVLGAGFGQVTARDLAAMVQTSGTPALRLTPWRAVLALGVEPGRFDGLISDADDPMLRVDACAGAPACPQAQVETRALARLLAPSATGTLHVSGCAKGCARATPADVVISGRDGAYALAFNALASDTPISTGLSAQDVSTALKAR